MASPGKKEYAEVRRNEIGTKCDKNTQFSYLSQHTLRSLGFTIDIPKLTLHVMKMKERNFIVSNSSVIKPMIKEANK